MRRPMIIDDRPSHFMWKFSFARDSDATEGFMILPATVYVKSSPLAAGYVSSESDGEDSSKTFQPPCIELDVPHNLVAPGPPNIDGISWSDDRSWCKKPHERNV